MSFCEEARGSNSVGKSFSSAETSCTVCKVSSTSADSKHTGMNVEKDLREQENKQGKIKLAFGGSQ